MINEAMEEHRTTQESKGMPVLSPEPWISPRTRYNFMKCCVESRPYPPIPQKCLDSIVARIAPELRESPETNQLLQQLCVEVTEEFHSVIFKHTVDTVLKNPDKPEQNSQVQKHSRPELKCVQFCHSTFIQRQRFLQRKLDILHPVMQTILDISYSVFTPIVLVELSSFRTFEPVDCKSLQRRAAVECGKKEAHILDAWFHQIIHFLTNEKSINGFKEEKLDSFYNCASTLMSIQLKSLLQRSVEVFASMFNPSNQRSLPIFRLALTFDDGKMEIYPTLQDLEASVLEILHSIANSLQRVQTVQSWLAQTSSSFMDASVPDEILTWARVTVTNAVRKHLEDTHKHFKSYVKNYDWLVNRNAQTQVNTFLEEEHTLDEYIKQVEEFHTLSKEITSLPSKVYFPMVHLECEELKQGLSDKAKMFVDILLKTLVTKHREQNHLICSEFETINKQVLEVPENTEAITQMVDYINYTRTKGVADLNEKIKEASTRLLYLQDVYTFEPEDLELNAAVFLWPKKILHAFELSNEVLQKAKEKGQKELGKIKINK